MTDLGQLRYFLGIEAVFSKGNIHLSQQKFARDILQRFNMDGAKPLTFPFKSRSKLVKIDGVLWSDPTPYRSAVGASQYLTFTGPDIQSRSIKLLNFNIVQLMLIGRR